MFGQGYGMSEATAAIAVATVGEPDADRARDRGHAAAGDRGARDRPGHRTDLGPDEEGELLARGPQLMRGYHGRPDATAATIDADGWLHTGDLAAVPPAAWSGSPIA